MKNYRALPSLLHKQGWTETSVKALKDASGSVSSAVNPALKAVESIQSAVRQMDEKISAAAGRVSEAVEQLEARCV